MPKVTAAYLETRRQQILDAAIACFARKGFHQTTMEDISQEAGLSQGLAYRYFESKEDIILATIEDSVIQLERLVETEAGEEDMLGLIEKKFEDDLEQLKQPSRENYYKVRVQLWAEALQNPKVAEKAQLLRQKGLKQYARLIRIGQERESINPKLDAMAVSLALAALHDGFILHWLADPGVDIQQYQNVLTAMVQSLANHSQ